MDKISRREFLKLTGLGTAASAALSSLYWPGAILDKLIGEIHTPVNTSKEVATACCGCPAGCGLIIKLDNGRLPEVKPNPIHPLSQGEQCPVVWSSFASLNSPHRLNGPVKLNRSNHELQPIDWDTADRVLAEAMHQYDFSEVAFILGIAPDHLYDVLALITTRINGGLLLRYSTQSELTAQVTLMDAAQSIFGFSKIPFFDLQHTDLIFSFGVNITDPWLAQLDHRNEQQVHKERLPYVVHFGHRQLTSGFRADEWIPIKPGGEAAVAGALGMLIKQRLSHYDLSGNHLFYLKNVSQLSGIPIIEFERLSEMFIRAQRKIALPGSSFLGNSNGFATSRKILELNIFAENLGESGGLYLLPELPVHADVDTRPNTVAQVSALIDRIKEGKIKVLMVHGVDIINELPRSLDVKGALDKLELLVSFSPLLNATAELADYVLPDHLPLESWGYQKVHTGVDRWVVSALQPVIAPRFDTHATVDVLLAAFKASRGELFRQLPFSDEASFLEYSLHQMVEQSGGNRSGNDTLLWKEWLENGGWWPQHQTLMPAVPIDCGRGVESFIGGELTQENNLDEFQLLLYPILSASNDGQDLLSAELTSVEVNPDTAREFEIGDGDWVQVCSRYGRMTVRIEYNSDIVQGVVGMPVFVGICNYEHGKSVQRLYQILGDIENESGNLAFNATLVKLEKIDKI